MITMMNKLRAHLAGLPSGPVADKKAIVPLLAAAWEIFDGSAVESMASYKVRRLEEPVWNPPVLSFTIERHGGTVMGSSRAELQRWAVNLDTFAATCGTAGHRQLRPTQPRLNVEPKAEDLVRLILTGQPDDRLKWREPSRRVQVLIGKIIPRGSAAKQTLEGRRRRLAGAIATRLEAAGWVPVADSAPRTYQKIDPEETAGS